MSSLADALRPVASQFGRLVREHEILRVAATIGGSDDIQTVDCARREVLAWAQRRSGGRLPPEAWRFDSFQYMSGGRNSTGVRFKGPDTDIWSIRAEDPDKLVPGRIWTTEVVVALADGLRPRLSVRLLASSSENSLWIEPHTPGLVHQIEDSCGLFRGDHELTSKPWRVETPHDIDDLCQWLISADRMLPVFVLSVSDGEAPAVDAPRLARAVLGIGEVVIASEDASWSLTKRFGQVRSVHSGAIRVYQPGFSEKSNPYDHRLILRSQLSHRDEQQRAERWMRSMAAADSLKANKLGRDVIPFSKIRDAGLRQKELALSSSGATESVRLAAALERISALENDLERELQAQNYFAVEADLAETRAEAAEAQHRAAVFHIQTLEQKLLQRGESIEQLSLPESWPEFSTWVDTELAGRVSITPAARRNCKDALFEDVELAARCVRWLGNEYRDGRMNGTGGDFVDFPIEAGIRNSACGGDEFDFWWQGRRQTADWHIKNGGNTRDPKLCLRIYYYWDAETSQVVIADLPAHVTSALS